MLFNYLVPFFIIIPHQFLFPFTNAIPFREEKMLISFVKSDQKMQISEYSKQKYEAHLGIVHFMRKKWQCDKIAVEFEEYERTECQKYRKFLDILHEYLFREYAGIPTVQPKFVFKGQIEIDGPIIYVVNCLVRISQFYFKKSVGQIYEYKFNELLKSFYNFEPKLLNEERLNFGIKLENEPKLPINEMILQLAIDTANDWQTNESLEGIIRQNFDNKLEEMLKKAVERAKEYGLWSANEINDDKHKIIVKFDDYFNWTKDALFLEFVKGLATNSEKFFKMAKEYANYLWRIKEKGYIYGYNRQMINSGLYKIKKMKKYLTQKYEAYLGVVYLMIDNWHCDKIGEEFNEYKRNICQKYRKYLHEFERTECQKNRKYLDILYEYLFRIYAEAKNPKESKQMPALVKQIFMDGNSPYFLILIVKKLNEISKYFWEKEEKFYIWSINLVNEEEMNYEIKEKKHWFDKNKHEKIGKRVSKNEAETNFSKLRKEFEALIEQIYKNVIEEKAKMEKTISETENDEEKKALEEEYNDKFGTFNSSPLLKIK